MTDALLNAAAKNGTATTQAGMRSILQWLELPLAPHPAEEIPSLRAHLKALRDVEGTPQQHARALDGLYTRSTRVIASLLPVLGDELVLPVPRKARRIVRSVLDLLQMLADDTLALLDAADPDAQQTPGLALWRSVNALAQQLTISHLIASPPRPGAWQQLHETFATARRLEVNGLVPEGESRSLQDRYLAAILLGCAQPASLTPPEILFLAAYFDRFSNLLQPLPVSAFAAAGPGTFWIDPACDAPALSTLRKAPPPTAPLDCFSCAGVCLLIKTQIAQMDAGTSPQDLNLPDFAATPAGRGVLGRLAFRWSDSGKRRFHRRKQDYRMLLGAGLDGVWQLSKKGEATGVELSTWMITNESPDGYAVMHVSGNTGALSVGDLAAVRTGSDRTWQVCIVRWAVSENPEHLELGLQILAPKAVPAILVQPSDSTGTEHLRVLILPGIPNLRTGQWLVVAAGALPKDTKRLLLVLEGRNVAVREFRSTYRDEQTGSVEILSIEADHDTA